MLQSRLLLRPITAKTLLLDFLRASAPHAWPVKQLVEVGKIFDISENALRVNATRLLAKGTVVQDERGSYSLADNHDPLREWVLRWDEGEKRLLPWSGDWLSLQLAPELKSKSLKVFEQACLRLGFRQLWQRHWLRPNNLALDIDQLSDQLLDLVGSEADCHFILAVSSKVKLPRTMPALASLWEVKQLEAQYKSHIKALEKSMANVQKKNPDDLLRETFVLGGEAIHLLAQDPLLPEQLFDVELRKRLTQLMTEYDEMGKSYWIERFSGTAMKLPPRHLESGLQQPLLQS